MSEAPKRIWGVFDQYGHGSTMLREIEQCRNPMYSGPEPTAYIRADLVEAAIKRALEGAAQSVDCACAGREAVLQCSHRNSRTRWECCGEANCSALEAADIRALDPAQFIEEPKP